LQDVTPKSTARETQRLAPVRAAARMAVETLEDRTLFAWGAYPTLTGQAAAAASYPTVTGAGYSIAVIDTGVDYMHPALGGGFGAGHKVIGGYDFVDDDADPMDTDGHGTGTAGAAAALPFTYNGATYQGAAPGANIVALRADSGGFGWNKEAPYAESALQWVIAHIQAGNAYNIVSVNISNGKGHYVSATSESPCADEFQTLYNLGIVVVNSSGNNGIQNGVPGIEYPGAEPTVYSIGAHDLSDNIWTSTERGEMMDILAPGVSVPLPYWLSPAANPTATNRHIYLQATGTSFAAPFVAGMIALIKQVNPSLTGHQIIDVIKQTGANKYDAVTGLSWPRASVNAAIASVYNAGDDQYEDNDTLNAAVTLSFTNDALSATNLKLLQGDADFYRFVLGARADVSFGLTTSGGQFTPSWTLFDSNGTTLRNLSASDLVRLPAGTYYVRVNAPASTLTGTYAISLARTVDDTLNNNSQGNAATITLTGGTGSVTGVRMLSNVDDYFKFTIGATSDVDLTVTYGGATAFPSAYLLSTAGAVLGTFTAGSFSPQLVAGTYYIRVTSGVNLIGTYSVSVDTETVVVPPPPAGTPGEGGTGNGIAYDSSGNLHFAWYDEATGTLKYAKRSAAKVWGAVETVDASPLTGQFVSLALDNLGRPGMAYLDSVNADLKYAHWNGSTWDVRVVDSNKITGYYPSMKYDAAGRPVISYYYKTGGDLRVAVGDSADGNTFTVTAIDTGNDVGRYSSLALNLLSGRWATAYEDTTTGRFKYAEQGKSAWAVMTVDAATKYGGGFISLAFSPVTKRPAMSYYDAYNADLKFATYNGSAWSARAVASKGSVGLYSNLRINAAGVADILYFSKTTDSVFRATATSAAASAWGFTEAVPAGAGRWITRANTTAGAETLAVLKGTDLEILDV